ncbi:MAG: sigma-70 family RNA polymerase sigma factor [Verrucomicrobiota bacterium]
MNEAEKEVILQITDWQNRLFGYLVTLLGNVHDAHDVLQETNLVLWKKLGDFEPGTDFGAWARRCAHFQALAFLRDRKRDRHLFDEELLHQFAEDDATPGSEEERELALRDCLSHLPEEHRKLIRQRYRDETSVRSLAASVGKKESAMKMLLMRIRQSLQVCIESKLKESAA